MCLCRRASAIATDLGEGVAKDERAAVGWYRRAAEAEHAAAQYVIGLCYADGIGIGADAREAAVWLERAAVSGDAEFAEKARDALAQLRARDPP